MGAPGRRYFDDEGQCELAEGDDGEYGEGHQAAGVADGAVQLHLLAVAQLAAGDVLPEQPTAAV